MLPTQTIGQRVLEAVQQQLHEQQQKQQTLCTRAGF
jgi:hypothetical protein